MPHPHAAAEAPAPQPQAAEWIEKHRPHSLEQIAVAKKKVQEAREWLVPFSQDAAPHPSHARVLLLTGGFCMGLFTSDLSIHPYASLKDRVLGGSAPAMCSLSGA